METESGKIVDIKNGKVVVQMQAGSQCQHCSAKYSCSALGAVERQIEISGGKDLTVGDHVTISYQAQSRIISAVLVFILPVMFLIIGYFVGFKFFGTEGKAILTALSGLVVSLIILWGLNKILAKDRHFAPTILKAR